MGITNKKFTDPELNKYDVMQHVRNIYNIIGVTNLETFKANDLTNIADLIDAVNNKSIVGWVGTREKFIADKASGKISKNTICAITDDYYDQDTN